jgi:hypothetical protein
MFVGSRRVFVSGPAMFVSSLGMLLCLLVLAEIMMVGGLVMMMGGSVMVSGSLMMVLTGRMLGRLCHIEFPPQPSEKMLSGWSYHMRSLPRHYCDKPSPSTRR